MCLGDWLRLLKRGQFRIHPLRMFMALIITLCAVVNSILTLLQRLIYGRRIAATEINHPPIFIIGHWRSGTTYLHELMVCDKRFAYPLITNVSSRTMCWSAAGLFPTLLWPLLPRQTADGQHGDRLVSAAGRRVRAGGDGGADAVLPDGVSE